MTYDLNGKVAVVTGTVSKMGIGFATAHRLAQDGADVAVVDKYSAHPRSVEDDRIEGWRGLDSVVEEIEKLGRRGLSVVADVTQSQQVDKMVDKVLAKFGKIDILVNNAGIPGPPLTPVMEYDEDIWRDVLSVNLIGPFLCSKAIAKRMVERGEGGKIINIASSAGKRASLPRVAYGASKAGLINLTQTLALELAQHKINVNAVCPGPTVTELGRGRAVRTKARESAISIEEATVSVYAELIPKIPLGKAAQPSYHANVVAFLASKESDHITGVALNVSGGWLMVP